MPDFHLFPRLPPELRHQIWREAEENRKIVHLLFSEDESGKTSSAPRYQIVALQLTSPD
jgi:hypothetical protein